MKKFFIIILSLLFILAVPSSKAEESDLSSVGDLWENWNASQSMYGQDKSVSDEDFDKVVDKLKEKKDKFKNKFKKNPVPKGEEFSQDNETEILMEHATEDTTLPVVCIPIELSIGDGVLPVGHYQIKGEKDDSGVFLNFYQAQYLMAKVPAIETEDDFGEETITFANWELNGDNKIKLFYGSIDFNAYTYLQIHKP